MQKLLPAISACVPLIFASAASARSLSGSVTTQSSSATVAAAAAAPAPTLTPIYCNYTPGNAPPPPETFSKFVNLGGKMCLNFGVTDVDDLYTSTLIGGSLDNTKNLTLSSVSFVVKNYNATAANYLNLYLYFKNTTTGPQRYAYATGASPSSRVKLANGDYQLTFRNTAFTPIYGGTMTGAIVQAMEIATIANRTYPVRSYMIHTVTINSTVLKTNTASGGPFKNCTF